MLNSHDLADRQILAAIREYKALDRRRYTIVKLAQPIQRGWRRHYVLSEHAQTRKDRGILEAILAAINTVVLCPNRNFRRRKRKSRRYVEIQQPLRSIRNHVWEQTRFPANWLPYFRRELVFERNLHWQPRWVFKQTSLFELKVERNWLWYFREVDPAIESRLSEIERWIEARQGWSRFGWLKGRPQHYRWRDVDTEKQRHLAREHQRDIARAYDNFPEVDPARPVRRGRISSRRFNFQSSRRSPTKQRHSAQNGASAGAS